MKSLKQKAELRARAKKKGVRGIKLQNLRLTFPSLRSPSPYAGKIHENAAPGFSSDQLDTLLNGIADRCKKISLRQRIKAIEVRNWDPSGGRHHDEQAERFMKNAHFFGLLAKEGSK